ncbi:MAG: hypothetical protein Q8P15_02185 [Nanoarchaeota archaeon]|nr:hypothetical protein [Nanoarchaeota archaeon]
MKNKNRQKIGQGKGIEVRIDDVILSTKEGPSKIVELLQENLTQPNHYWKRIFTDGEGVSRIMQNYIETLKRGGLDIGKGEAQYGYRMPLEPNQFGRKELIIFTRK